jgi:hypothetical protein
MAISRKEQGHSIKFNVELQDLSEKEKWPQLDAFLYNRAGRLVARAALKPNAKHPNLANAVFEFVDEVNEKALTVKIAAHKEDVRALSREKIVTYRFAELAKVEGTATAIIPRPIWYCWIMVFYLARGTVEKWTGGEKLPVCLGEVDIYDVDVRCLLRIPDIVIERIRDSIIDLILDPPPIDVIKQETLPSWWGDDDDDWCGTPPKLRPPRNLDLDAKLAKLPREWAFARTRVAAMDTARTRLDQTLVTMRINEKQQWLNSEAGTEVKLSQVVYSNTQQFRTLLTEKFQVFRYWLCWYPWIHWMWWPWCRSYGLEKLGTATLQPDGSFAALVPMSICRTDTPDLWFKVRQTISGTERVIYARYPVLCNTYWNHPSGDPVSLLTYDSEALVCESNHDTDEPGIYVMPMGIGDDGWYQIEQAHLKPGDIAGADRGLYGGSDPYGTRLDIRMQFHDSLKSIGVEYYRWSIAPADTMAWSHLNETISHRYLTQIGSDFFIVPETLGPDNVGGKPSLFKVPDPAKDWIALNRNDRAFAVWNTAVWDATQNRYVPQVADGRYVLRLEMFDAAGNNLNPTAAGAGWMFFLPTAAAVGGVWPVDNAPHVQADGSVHFNLWVDNTDTTADIQSVGLSGTPTGDCQFMEYEDDATDTVEVTYVAYHKLPPQRDFLASYSLSVKRGVSGTTVDGMTQTVPAQTPTVRSNTVSHLLREVGGKGPYPRCAFAVELHAYPRTRDGYSRIRQYESHDTSAFALMANP